MRMPRIRPGYVLVLFALASSPPSLLGAGWQAAPAAVQPPQSAAVKLPAAQEILDRHTKAIGGRAAILARTSAQATGTMTMPEAGISGTLVMYSAKPDKRLVRVSIPSIGEIEEGYDGVTGWTINPMTGPEVAAGLELEERKLDSDFYGLELADRYESITTIEQTTFDGRRCYKLRLARKGGGEDFHFYDVESGLKAGSIVTRQNAMGKITATSVEKDYKPFGGLLHPTRIVNTIGPLQQVISVSSVEYDRVNPAVFYPPPAIKALLK
jgi:hypothetical protein